MNTQTYLTVKCEFTGKVSVREVGFLSEFFTGTEDYRIRQCEEWIAQRGNAQHNTLLSLVKYEIVRH